MKLIETGGKVATKNYNLNKKSLPLISMARTYNSVQKETNENHPKDGSKKTKSKSFFIGSLSSFYLLFSFNSSHFFSSFSSTFREREAQFLSPRFKHNFGLFYFFILLTVVIEEKENRAPFFSDLGSHTLRGYGRVEVNL